MLTDVSPEGRWVIISYLPLLCQEPHWRPGVWISHKTCCVPGHASQCRLPALWACSSVTNKPT